MNKQPPRKRDPIELAILFDWMRQALEDAPPAGLAECWRCHQWRPDNGANDNDKGPNCGADHVPF